ncbi:MAG TPA: hypothetical protein VFT33_08350 [Gaiellaceae bacterium]|nr:hypothetical protein [Gaiellaceae bacterium]
MRRMILILAVGITAAAVTAVGGAQTPTETPFPSPKVVQYFVAAQTVTGPGATEGAGVLLDFFPQGSTVVFRATAGETKTGKLLTADQSKYFYVKIPGQPNVKLTYQAPSKKAAGAQWTWSGTWTVPADYALGIVPFKVLLKTKAGAYGSFVQMPPTSSQLTVTKKA